MARGRRRPRGPSYAGLAEIAYQRDELDSALRHATEGIALCRRSVHTTPLASGLAILAMIRQATGDPAGALAAITEPGQAAPGPPGLLNPVPAQRARLLLAQGDLAGAARFAQENGLGPDDEPGYAREPGYLVLARILLARDRPGQALALLDRLVAARRAGSGFQAAAGVPLGYLARLQRAFAAGPAAADPGPSGIVDPLTRRELEVLEMVAAGRSNQAIAGELVVTLDTVKKHVGHVLGKLGAANRTEAVARGRELSLIP